MRCPYATCLGVLLFSSACGRPRTDIATMYTSSVSVARANRLNTLRQSSDTSVGRETPLAYWQMPEGLQEISGQALTSDGRMLVHGDEIGQVWEVDYRRGILVKSFTLGDDILRDDFESIAVVGDDIFMLTSRGALYQLREAENGKRVPYSKTDTGLEKECEFEAMTYDPSIKSLIFVCKENLRKSLGDDVTIFRWNLTGAANTRLSKITIPLASVVGENKWKELHPTDVAIDPLTGNYVIVASIERALFSVTPQGAVVFARPLPPGHQQAEGLSITKDSLLILSDEAAKIPASISIYRWP